MADNIVVEVEERTDLGKNAAGRLRRAGKVPGIVYGLDRPPFAVTVNPRRLTEVLRLETGKNTILNLSLVGQDRTRAVMIREIQRDPVTELPVHVDFVRVDLERAITVAVPIRLLGTPVGVKTEGGLLEFVTREIDVECLPGDIPEHVDVDVSELHVNQNVHVSDLGVGERIKVLTSMDTIVALVAVPKEEAAPAVEEAAAAPAEPEVIKKGKEEAPAEKSDKS
ncbi:MAG TPA: 50S ribosomal protein L25 [Candidatus Polarisedimenticolaceae bacterium]|nr:50S ribosomal protein L25 [Candidatus Polarisedimenticolaceae bacterium]